MTVPTSRSREDYTGNGVANAYPYRFRIYKQTDLVVTRATPDGVETPLVLGTDYTVTGVGNYAGGNVVLDTALPVNHRLAIERALPVTQETDLRNQGAYFAETHEDVFDRAVMILQRIAGYLGLGPDGAVRTLLLGKTDIDGQGAFRARGNRIQDLGDPVNDQDAANKRWALSALRSFSLDNNQITTNGVLTPAASDDAVPAATGGGNVSQAMNAMVQAVLNKITYVRASLSSFTTGGTAPAFTLTPVPALPNYAAGQRFRVKFHASGTGDDKLSASGLGAKSIKQYDSTGAKVAAVIAAGQLADVEYDGVDFVVLDPLPAVQPVQIGVQGSFKNLSAAADGISSIVTAWMDECIVKDSSGVPRLLSNVALSVNLSTAGANGLDTGAVAANGWYSLWAIYNPTTQTAAGIAALCPVLTGNTTAGSAVVTGLSSTANMRAGMPVSGGNLPAGSVIKSVDSGSQITLTSKALTTVAGASLTFVYDPVMPAGYTMRARFCMCRTDGTANKYPLGFVQAGRRVQYRVASGSNVTAVPILASGTQGSPTTPTYVQVSVSNVAPPTAADVSITLVSTTLSAQAICAPNASYGAFNSQTNPAPLSFSGSSSYGANLNHRMVLETGAVFFASSASAGNNPLCCHGWEDNI